MVGHNYIGPKRTSLLLVGEADILLYFLGGGKGAEQNVRFQTQHFLFNIYEKSISGSSFSIPQFLRLQSAPPPPHPSPPPFLRLPLL